MIFCLSQVGFQILRLPHFKIGIYAYNFPCWALFCFDKFEDNQTLTKPYFRTCGKNPYKNFQKRIYLKINFTKINVDMILQSLLSKIM